MDDTVYCTKPMVKRYWNLVAILVANTDKRPSSSGGFECLIFM